MAIHACSPVAPPRIIGRSDELDQGEWLGKALRDAEAKGLFTEQREGFDRRFYARATRDLANMLPMEIEELQGYALKRGWLKTKTTKGVKEAVPGAMNAEEAGYANALFKVYLESRAGGVKQLADNFLMKVKAGENATIEGLQFAQEMQGLSRFGSYVLGWDQQIGRGLRQSGLAKSGFEMNPSKAVEGFADTAVGSAEDNLQYATKFERIAAQLGDPTQAQEAVAELIGLARQTQFLEEPHKISKAVLGMEAAGNAWQELFVNGLLSSPTSFVTNVLGAIWVPTRALLQYGAAEAWAMSGAAGSAEARIVAAEAAASLSMMGSAMNEALQIGWHAFKTETSLYQATRKGITANAAASLVGKSASELPDAVVDTITRVGDFVRLPSRALLGTDEFAKHLAIRGEVAARAIRRAAREGVDLTDQAALRSYMEREAKQAFTLSGKELIERSAKEGDQYVAGLRAYDALQMAEGNKSVAQIAAEATFQEENQVASSVNQLLGSVPGGQMLRPFIPFVRTPLNIIKQGFFESTGISAIHKGISVSAKNPTRAVWAIQQELLKDPAETARIAGQMALTTTLGFWMYSQAMSGRITGGGPGRWTAGRNGKAAQDAWVAAGNVPYSIQIGDQRVSFDRFGEPVAIVLRMFSDLGMYAAYMDQTEQEETFSGMVGIALSGLYQASFLQGVETLVKVGQEDSDYALGQAVQNWAATQTPFGGLLAFVDRVQDPYKGAYEGASFAEVMKVHEDTFGTGIFGKLANRIPGLGTAPQLVDQLTGMPVPVVPGVGPGGLNPLQMAIPILPRKSSADAVWQAVWDIKGSYIEKRPPYKLAAKEQQQLNTLMASTRLNGQTLAERIRSFRNRADVQQYVSRKGAAMPGVSFGIEKELDRIISEHYQEALTQLELQNNDVLLRSRLHDAKALAASENNINDVQAIGGQLDDLYQRARRGY